MSHTETNEKQKQIIKMYSSIMHEYSQQYIDHDVPLLPIRAEIMRAIESLNHDLLKDIIKKHVEHKKLNN
jgi:hypothetical protein